MNAFENSGRRWNPPIAPAGEAGAERFAEPAPFVTSRITTPLTGPTPVAPAQATYAATSGASPTPRRSPHRGSGPGGLLLSGLLGLGLVLGGVGGGAASLLVQQSQRTVAPAAVAPAASINPSGVANTSTSLIRDVYNKGANSVVSVQVRAGNGGPFGAGGEGSGIVLDSGHVLTNYHVVDGASVIHILLADNTSVTATVAGSAAQDDLALLAANLPADKVTPAVLGDSDSAQ